MRRLFNIERDSGHHTHGWDVPLVCGQCGHEGVPEFEGWRPNVAIRFGRRPTIFAVLHCPRCQAILEDEAGEALVECFAEVPICSESRRAILLVIGLTFVQVAVLAAALRWGLWGLALTPVFVVFTWLMYRASRRVERAHQQCACGQPELKFMGMLGRSLCYRCSACGQLKRVLS